MFDFVLSGWRSGLRGHSFRGLAVLAVALLGLAYLAAGFSARQPQSVALDVGLSGLRFSLVLMALFWVQELMTREVERRTVNLTLAYPIDRAAYVLGRFVAIAGLLLTAVVVLGAALWLATRYSSGGYTQARPVQLGLPYWIALLGIWLDVLVVTAFGVMLASLSTVAILPLAVGAAFAIAGKTLGPVMDFLFVREAEGIEGLAERYSPIIDTLRWFLPDLSRLDWRPWPMYGLQIETPIMLWSALMAIGYSALMLAIAVLVFRRREFG